MTPDKGSPLAHAIIAASKIIATAMTPTCAICGKPIRFTRRGVIHKSPLAKDHSHPAVPVVKEPTLTQVSAEARG